MPMYNPPHPGDVILDLCIEPLGLTITEVAKELGVKKKELDDFVNCRVGVTADLAIRLEKAFGSSADLWCRMQVAHDLFQAKKHAHKIKVQKIKPKRAVAVSLRPQQNILR